MSSNPADATGVGVVIGIGTGKGCLSSYPVIQGLFKRGFESKCGVQYKKMWESKIEKCVVQNSICI